MSKKLSATIRQWLALSGISLSENYLGSKLQSHPDFPSLLSITDVLEEAGISSASLVVDKSRFEEIPVPFLAHIKTEDFIIVSDRKKILEKNPAFLQQWDGIVVLAEPGVPDNTDNKEWLAKDKRKKQEVWLSIIVVAALCIAGLLIDFSWPATGLLIASLTGLVVSILLVQHELGISNELTDQLCHAGKNTDCDAVLRSGKSGFLKWLNLPDASLVWFASISISLLISLFAGTTIALLQLLAPVAFVSIAVTLISLYYQWRVVKKWCTLCLLVIGALWLQAPVLLSFIGGFQLLPVAGLILSVAALVMIAWLIVLKPMLKKIQTTEDANYRLLRFRNNPTIFQSLLQQQRRVDTIAWPDDLQLGNKDASLQLLVVCNPYCRPCASAHQVLHGLAERKDIGITIRFAVDTSNKETAKYTTILYLFQLLSGTDAVYKRKVIHDWYRSMAIEAFRSQYPLQHTPDITELLLKSEEWVNKANIRFTPTIFINGYELPSHYAASDLPGLINAMIIQDDLPVATVQEPIAI